jgi:hypothetical protein
MTTTPAQSALAPTGFLRHRVAVSIMFLLNGLLVGGWAPAIPVFKDNHALAESQLGLMILLIGIGSLLTMPVTGAIIARRGSTGILKIQPPPALSCCRWPCSHQRSGSPASRF